MFFSIEETLPEIVAVFPESVATAPSIAAELSAASFTMPYRMVANAYHPRADFRNLVNRLKDNPYGKIPLARCLARGRREPAVEALAGGKEDNRGCGEGERRGEPCRRGDVLWQDS